MLKHCIVLFIATLLLAGCVGKRKHLEMISSLQKQHEAETGALRGELDAANKSIHDLTLELVGQKGANEALLTTQDKLQQRIDDLQAEIDRLKNNVSNQQESFGAELQMKEKELAVCSQRIANISGLLADWSKGMESVAEEIRTALAEEPADLLAIEAKDGNVTVVMFEKLLFKPGSTSKVENGALKPLETIAEVVKSHPELSVRVVGHTDNQPVPRKSLESWDYSLLRAGTVVKVLTEEFDLGPNRVIAAGKSEFEPRTSNETAEGRAQNRRVEVIIQQSEDILVRDIRRVLAP